MLILGQDTVVNLLKFHNKYRVIVNEANLFRFFVVFYMLKL